jgi:hypothetical protein
MACKAGYKAVLTIGGVTVGKARDVTVTMDKTLADASVRDGNGFWGRCPALRGISISADQLWVEDDAGLLAIESAWLNDTLVAIQIVDITGGKGWSFNGYIGTLEKGEPLNDVQTFSFEAESDGTISTVNVS